MDIEQFEILKKQFDGEICEIEFIDGRVEVVSLHDDAAEEGFANAHLKDPETLETLSPRSQFGAKGFCQSRNLRGGPDFDVGHKGV